MRPADLTPVARDVMKLPAGPGLIFASLVAAYPLNSLPVAGYANELDDAGRARLPSKNLRATDRFDADFGVEFDMAIAQSVFTHVSLNWIRLCLARVAQGRCGS